MRPEQWETFKRAARLEKQDNVPMALIVDSPWIPGYLGIKHMDYYLDPELWFESNLKIAKEFPDVILVPSWWMEYGMAAEPSILGAKIKFWEDNTPSEYHTLYRLEDIDEFPEYEVEADAFAAMTLHRYKMAVPRIKAAGEILPMVTARGPLCTAGFVRSTTNLMIEIVEKPDEVHRLIDLCTRVIIDWLKAQHKVLGDDVEGIFILDDIVGFINEEHYMEFAHPYLKRICDAFPKDWVKLYHNDAEVDACPRSPARRGVQRPQLGQAERHQGSEAARRRSHVPHGQRESAGDCGARNAGRSEGGHARSARGRNG
jgi:uroporphyrinogen decarboxylase